MRDKFGNATITLADQADGSCEVNLDGEFIGVIFRDDEDDEVSTIFTWRFSTSILRLSKTSRFLANRIVCARLGCVAKLPCGISFL